MWHRVNQFFKPVLTMLLTGAISVMLSACGSSNIDNSVEHSASQYAQQVVNLGPGAQEACVSAGGLPALTLELNGSQTAVCQFANGKRCAVDIIQSGACI
ncbi:DUF333 domain-containing protein [Providencia rettgeri]|uniref:DUF333 domain-containing protein n=1 Tax=Providencia TaxID=586 RepID=UPI0013DF5A8F|nr:MULTISPECIES: DUF333 domain-containing protein [unclassified Providencia]QIF57817.1 DUF333 domain-containing protein [Providencia sp. 1701011]QIF61858.1 DUF333 domain-containing protein [Providencia sp. 1701091]